MLVITFLPRSKRLLISWLQLPSAVILEPPKIKSDIVSTVSPSISHEVMGLEAMIFVFWMLSFRPTFSLSSFTFIKRLFSSSSLSAILSVLLLVTAFIRSVQNVYSLNTKNFILFTLVSVKISWHANLKDSSQTLIFQIIGIDYTFVEIWQPTPVFLPGESHGQRSLAGYSPLGCKESGKTEATEHAHKHLNCSKISFRFNRFVSLTSQVSLAFPLHIWLIFSYFLKLCIFFTYLNILQKLLIIVSSSIYEEGKKSIFVFVLFPIKIVVLEWATSGLLCKISLHKIHWGKCFNQQNGPYTSESHPPM